MRKRSRIRPVFTIPEECDNDCKKKIINDVLSQIYPQLQINALKVASDNSPWLEDILPHAIITYLEKPLDYQWKIILDNKLEEFITYVMAFQLKSGNSPFYGHYRKFGMKWDRNVEIGSDEKNKFGSEVFEVFADEKSNKVKIAERIYDSLNFYEQNIIQKIYMEGWKITQFSEYYGIPYNEATTNIYSLRQKIARRVKVYKEKYDI
jgi:hypothetical protein